MPSPTEPRPTTPTPTPAPPPKKTWAVIPPRETIRRRYFPDVRLVTHRGKTVRLYEDLIRDKIVVLNFFYATCTGICIPVNANLARLQTILGKRMGRDIFICSFTLKPAEDTPQVLRHYARKIGARPGWQFVTGAPADLELVRRRLGFTDPDPVRDADKSNHIGMVRYGNEPLTLWSACPGLTSPEALARSILAVATPPPSPPEAMRVKTRGG